jgi:NADH dehydrogenase
MSSRFTVAASQRTGAVIDRTNHHASQPLLYQVAKQGSSTGEIAPSAGGSSPDRRTTVLLGEITAVDLDRKVMVSQLLDKRTETRSDSLIVTSGSTTSYLGHENFESFAPG